MKWSRFQTASGQHRLRFAVGAMWLGCVSAAGVVSISGCSRSSTEGPPVSNQKTEARLQESPQPPRPVAAKTEQPVVEPSPENRPLVVHQDGYVGSQSCVECHASQSATWRASYHRTMTQVATPETVVGEFENVELEYRGSPIQLTRRGDEFWVEMDDPDSDPAEGAPSRVTRQIVQTTGSHHNQAYWYPAGSSRKLRMFPMFYRIDVHRWLPVDAAFLTPPNFIQLKSGGRWNRTCNMCHATGVKPRLAGPEVMDTHVAELGISCEACHGPAQQHVQLEKYDEDLKIVHPAHLAARRSSQVCGQCHSINTFPSAEAFKHWRVHGLPYRPGDDLHATRYIPTAAESDHPLLKMAVRQNPMFLASHFWSDLKVRVTGREYSALIQSPCYQHSDETRTISCLSCHTMHKPEDDPRPIEQWKDDMLADGMRTNLACTGCHQSYQSDGALLAHTHHPVESSGSLCYNCHMPFTSYGLLKAVRSHTMDAPSVRTHLDVGRPNACNQCHLDKTLKWTADRLADWYGIESGELPKDQRTVAASVMMTLQGDAGQRALMAWSMGWNDARDVSGSDWLTPYLINLLLDKYAAVRFIAYRSLRQQPGFEDFEFDYLAGAAERNTAGRQKLAVWNRSADEIPRRTGDEILIQQDGSIKIDEFRRLLRQRDNRPLYLSE